MPSSSSFTEMRVTSRASMVPRSHSRVITRAVSRAPIRVMITASTPGTRKSVERICGLNQMRCSSATGACRVRPARSACCSSQPYQMAWM